MSVHLLDCSRWVRIARAAMCALALALAIPGCSSAYDAALRDMALEDDRRLDLRVQEMMRSADHAIESMEHAARLRASGARHGSASPDVRTRVVARLNDAEASVFAFRRGALAVEDAAQSIGSEPEAEMKRFREAVSLCGASMDAVLELLRGPFGGDDHGGIGAGAEDVSGAIARARTDAASVRRHASLLGAR